MCIVMKELSMTISRNINDVAAARVVIYVVSSDMVKL